MGKGVVEALYESLQPEDQDTFAILIREREISGGWIATLIREHYQVPVNRHQVEHFRRKINSGNYDLDTIGKSHELG